MRTAAEFLSKVEFYDEHDVLVPAEDFRWRDAFVDEVETRFAINIQAIAEAKVDAPEWFTTIETSARGFLASLGFVELQEISLLGDNEAALAKIDMDNGTMAMVDVDLPGIIVRESAARDMYNTCDEILVGSLLVHEMAHDTSIQVDRVAIRAVQIAGKTRFKQDYRSGFSINGTNEPRGSFLEEGFAQFIGGWYFRSRTADYTSVIGITQQPSKKVPPYLSGMGFGSVVGPDGYAVELLAWGVERAGIMSANDFVATLLDTRRAETQLAALRTVAQTIDQLQPGLYTKLSKLQYSTAAWRHGRDIVHQAVTQTPL